MHSILPHVSRFRREIVSEFKYQSVIDTWGCTEYILWIADDTVSWWGTDIRYTCLIRVPLVGVKRIRVYPMLRGLSKVKPAFDHRLVYTFTYISITSMTNESIITSIYVNNTCICMCCMLSGRCLWLGSIFQWTSRYYAFCERNFLHSANNKCLNWPVFSYKLW